MFALGKLTHNERAADTGKLAGEAILHTQLVVQAMKFAFNRERPDKVGGTGGFWNGGRSFPSGHAASSFAFATILAGRYKNKFAVFGAYGLATAVSMSRIGGMNHHPSDVLIGAAIGHLVGRFILHRHPAEQ
jgi:membrane-associated phospholipid phosphatase